MLTVVGIGSLLICSSKYQGQSSYANLTDAISRQYTWGILREAKNSRLVDAAKREVSLPQVMNIQSVRVVSLLLWDGLGKAQYVSLGQSLARNSGPTESTYWLLARLPPPPIHLVHTPTAGSSPQSGTLRFNDAAHV